MTDIATVSNAEATAAAVDAARRGEGVAVLVPCYNEAPTIAKVVSDFRAALPEATIYVYDNNSTDGTADIAAAAGAVVRRESRQGKGNVVRSMFRDIDAEYYLMVDGDDTYPAEAAGDLLAPLAADAADMTVGDRISNGAYGKENERPFHNFGNSLVRTAINCLFHSDIKDIMTGYRAFSYQFVKTFPVLSGGFEIETEMTIHAVDRKMYVENSDGFRVLMTIARLFRVYCPLRFFGLLALLLAAVSILLFLPILLTYLDTGLVPRFPTLIVSGFIMVAALQSLFCGLLLDNMRQKDCRDFEFQLQQAHDSYRRMQERA